MAKCESNMIFWGNFWIFEGLSNLHIMQVNEIKKN